MKKVSTTKQTKEKQKVEERRREKYAAEIEKFYTFMNRGYQKFKEKEQCGEERKTKKDTERT